MYSRKMTEKWDLIVYRQTESNQHIQFFPVQPTNANGWYASVRTLHCPRHRWIRHEQIANYVFIQSHSLIVTHLHAIIIGSSRKEMLIVYEIALPFVRPHFPFTTRLLLLFIFMKKSHRMNCTHRTHNETKGPTGAHKSADSLACMEEDCRLFKNNHGSKVMPFIATNEQHHLISFHPFMAESVSQWVECHSHSVSPPCLC